MSKLKNFLFIPIFLFLNIGNLIENDAISKTTIVSVSVREAATGKIVYEKNGNLLLHPASTLKAFTTPVIMKSLGADYAVKTSLYKDNKSLYLKLSGDPLLTAKDLNELFKNRKTGILIIDDSAIDDVPWGIGWMWDDQSNPLMPKFSAYNLGHNLSAENIPVENTKENFLSQLDFKGEVKAGGIPASAVLISEISHSLQEEVENITKNSDNLASETLFKLAAGGTTEAGLKNFKKFYKEIGSDTSELFIVDASGVSHNDLIQTNWMTLALSKLYNIPDFKDYSEILAKPGEEGTLQYRLKDFSGRLWAKTGTLAGISGITGYLKAKSGKVYCFAILIQNYKGSSERAKVMENKIINSLYNKYY